MKLVVFGLTISSSWGNGHAAIWRGVLKGFAIDAECFRFAPEYDFGRPPHAGALHYEALNWGITGAGWRQLAAAALQQLEIE